MRIQRSTTSHSIAFTAIAALILSLQGCGGGGGGAPASKGDDNLRTPASLNTPASFDAGTVEAGWTYEAGASLYTAASNTWILQNSSNASLTNVSATANSASGVTTYTYGLQYNFGCGTASIVLRTQDCRNVVSMSAGLNGSKNISADSSVSFYVRNADASAQFALRIRDSSGQTLNYPFQTRFIESQDPTQWVRVTVPLKYPGEYWGTNSNGIPQGTLSAIEVVASSLNSSTANIGLNYPIGKIEIKNVELHDSTNTEYKLATNNAVKVNGFESYAPVMAVAHNTFDSTLLDKAKAVGFNAIRKDIFWEDVEITNGVFDFTAYTTGMQTLKTKQMKVLWILDYTNPVHGATVNGVVQPPQSQPDIDAFARYAKKVAELTASKQNVVGYEIWNEPDQDGFWPTPDPVKYATLLNAARTYIRQADTTTPVVSGGIGIDTPDYLFKLAQTGALNNVNAIGVHPYRKDIIITSSPSYKRALNTPENYASEMIVNRNALLSQGVTTPMWNTEWGYSTVFFIDRTAYPSQANAESRQGLLTLRMVLTQLAMKEPLITVYNLVDKYVDLANKEYNFGLLRAQSLGYAEKPAYTGLKTLYQHSKDRTFKGYLTDVPNGMHVLRWDGAADRTFCAWLDDQGRPATLKLPANVKTVTRWDGTIVTLSTNPNDPSKFVSLREEDGPVFVLF